MKTRILAFVLMFVASATGAALYNLSRRYDTIISQTLYIAGNSYFTGCMNGRNNQKESAEFCREGAVKLVNELKEIFDRVDAIYRQRQ